MKKIFCILLLTSLPLFSQNYETLIIGHVVTEKGNLPLVGVNVYLSGTMYGTSTDSKGKYKLENVPPGNYRLSFSIIGYNSEHNDIVISKGTKVLIDKKLTERVYKLNEAVVKSERPTEWNKNRDIFYYLFLGRTVYLKHCTIENLEYINFEWVGLKLKATAQKPLIIYNRALGYKITCDLDSFYYDKEKKITNTQAGFLYEELQPSNEKEKQFWDKNRKYTSLSSIRHFFLWLMSRNKNHFEYEICRTKNCSTLDVRPGRQTLSESDIAQVDSVNNGLYLRFTGNVGVINKHYLQQSCLQLLKDELYVDQFGIVQEENAYKVYGQWALEGVANLLPRFYEYEQWH